MSTKKLKNDYRHAHTHVLEHTVGSGKQQRVIRSRARREDAPSLKAFAVTHDSGSGWFSRKRGGT